MSISEGQIRTAHGAVSCALDHHAGSPLLVCAHGAGGSYADRSLAAAASAMRAAGLGSLRFNFAYRERGAGRPDRMPVLTETFASVVQAVRAELRPPRLLIGGRSMGGRAASVLAAEGLPCDGLILLAYPLHPPGQTARLRAAHLPALRIPVLCFNGTRDAFCERPLMERTLEAVSTDWTMHWLDGADHSFRVLKSSGRTDAAVLSEVTVATRNWLVRHGLMTGDAVG